MGWQPAGVDPEGRIEGAKRMQCRKPPVRSDAEDGALAELTTGLRCAVQVPIRADDQRAQGRIPVAVHERHRVRRGERVKQRERAVGGDAEDRAQIVGAAAQYESKLKGERVRAKHAQNARDGKSHGGPRPFGYERGSPGELVIKPDEAAVIREMADRVLAGESVRSLAIDLTARGVPTVKGAIRWAPTTVVGVLRSPRLAGLVSLAGRSARVRIGMRKSWPAGTGT